MLIGYARVSTDEDLPEPLLAPAVADTGQARMVRQTLEQVVDGLRPRFAQAATLLAEAAEDLLAHKHFPKVT